MRISLNPPRVKLIHNKPLHLYSNTKGIYYTIIIPLCVCLTTVNIQLYSVLWNSIIPYTVQTLAIHISLSQTIINSQQIFISCVQMVHVLFLYVSRLNKSTER